MPAVLALQPEPRLLGIHLLLTSGPPETTSLANANAGGDGKVFIANCNLGRSKARSCDFNLVPGCLGLSAFH